MKKIMILCCVTAFLSGCSPVNRFTRLRKLPRVYSENYQIPGIKAPKSGAHKKPWIVYSDREGNAAYVNPGGRIKSAETTFREPFLVIGHKGDFLRLIKYKPEHIKNNRFTGRKKAEYIGWMHSSRLILSPSSVTDIRSGQHDKLLTAVTDTSSVLHPEAYFVTADSLKVFGDPGLEKQTAAIGMNEIVFALKYSPDGRGVLISRTTDITADKAGEQIVGWIPEVMLGNIGRKVFVKTGLAGTFQQPDILAYSPVIRPYSTDSTYTFCSGAFAPLIDKSLNFVYNIDGQPVSYSEGRAIKHRLQNINLLFAMESGTKQAEQFPMLLNAIQNLQPLFELPDDNYRYRFGAAISLGGKIVTIPLTSDYQSLTDGMSRIASVMRESCHDSLPAWSALKMSLDLLDDRQQSTNLIVSVGETGSLRDEAINPIVAALKKKNCRLLGWQLYAADSDNFNNFVLQLGDMIDAYAGSQVVDKRKMLFYADQFFRSNLLRDAGNNFFMLDYPYASMTQGGFLFPEKGETLSPELFTGAVDSIMSQIRADNRLLSESIDRAFATIGNDKDRFDSLFIAAFGLPQGTKPGKDFKRTFVTGAPAWYTESERISVPDSLVHYQLLLSEVELEQLKGQLETLCALEVDVKNSGKPRKGSTKNLCRYLQETEHLSDKELAARHAETESPTDTVYVSTKKIRRHLYKFYMHGLNECRVCRFSRKELNRFSLARAHRRIFGLPSNNPFLDGITLKELKKKKILTDHQLDLLVQYFKKIKEEMDAKAGERQVPMGSHNYYYIDAKLLP